VPPVSFRTIFSACFLEIYIQGKKAKNTQTIQLTPCFTPVEGHTSFGRPVLALVFDPDEAFSTWPLLSQPKLTWTEKHTAPDPAYPAISARQERWYETMVH